MNTERRLWVWIAGSLESSAPWKHDKAQDKNRSASTCAVVDSSLYTYLQAWVEGRSPMPHPGGDSPPAVGGAGLQIWTKNVAGKAGQGNSYRAVIGFCRKSSADRADQITCAWYRFPNPPNQRLFANGIARFRTCAAQSMLAKNNSSVP